MPEKVLVLSGFRGAVGATAPARQQPGMPLLATLKRSQFAHQKAARKAERRRRSLMPSVKRGDGFALNEVAQQISEQAAREVLAHNTAAQVVLLQASMAAEQTGDLPAAQTLREAYNRIADANASLVPPAPAALGSAGLRGLGYARSDMTAFDEADRIMVNTQMVPADLVAGPRTPTAKERALFDWVMSHNGPPWASLINTCSGKFCPPNFNYANLNGGISPFKCYTTPASLGSKKLCKFYNKSKNLITIKPEKGFWENLTDAAGLVEGWINTATEWVKDAAEAACKALSSEAVKNAASVTGYGGAVDKGAGAVCGSKAKPAAPAKKGGGAAALLLAIPIALAVLL